MIFNRKCYFFKKIEGLDLQNKDDFIQFNQITHK